VKDLKARLLEDATTHKKAVKCERRRAERAASELVDVTR
jgi:hypothetical protein